MHMNNIHNESTNEIEEIEINGNDNSVKIDNSVNITYNIIVNVNQRENLKNKMDGSSHEFTMFYLNKCNYLHKDGYEFAICSNICYNYEFMSEHVHVRFKEGIISDFFKFKLVTVSGSVYRYKRKDGTEDYAIDVEEIIDVKDRFICKNFNIQQSIKNIDVFDQVLENYPDEILYDMVQNQLSMLDLSFVDINNNIRPGFLSGIIMTRYFLNTQLKSLVNQQSVLRNANRECLVDVFKLISKILYDVDKHIIYKWEHLMKELNLICNYLQQVTKDVKDRNDDDNKIAFNNLKEFGRKIDCNNVKKLHGMNAIYNKNYGFSYPENIEEFENELRERVLCYMLTKGYVKSKNK